MTQPPSIPQPPVVYPQVAATSGVLRTIMHPDLSPALTHFCDRARPQGRNVRPDIIPMSAHQRLESILWAGTISGFVTYSGGNPAVCMTETRQHGLEFLIRDRSYQPWALIFDRQKVYDAGGGPVWYARPEEWAALQNSPQLQTWAVRLDPGSDWLEEREWRVPRPPNPFSGDMNIPLSTLGLVALVVADLQWTAARYGNNGDGRVGWFTPPAIQGLPRFWWNAQEQKLTLYESIPVQSLNPAGPWFRSA